jgi:hypothetical protein
MRDSSLNEIGDAYLRQRVDELVLVKEFKPAQRKFNMSFRPSQ